MATSLGLPSRYVGRVWFGRMGMLDDAIREHLELKRLRGADPGEVARAENEALGPLQREIQSAIDTEPTGEEPYGKPPEGGDSERQPTQIPKHQTEASAPGGVGQETVEIDMEQALGDVSAPSKSQTLPRSGSRAAPVGHPAHTASNSEESLEWEMPGERVQSESASIDEAGADEPVEDVLEETPDFLRETPEHERLWFEQRPPRDFDFNE